MVTVLGIVTFRVFPPKMGGQKGVALFYKYLSRHMEVKLALTGENDPIHAKAYGVAITPMLFPNKSIYANLSRLNTLEKLVQQAQAQVLISEHSYPGFMALWIKQRTGKPFIIHSHNIEAMRFKQMGRVWWKAYFIYERWIDRKADFNFFISEKDQAFALKEFGLSPEKCAVITYGIVQQRLPVGADKKIIKRHLGLQDSELLFLFNGTLDYAPNIDAVKGLINQ